MSNRVLCKFFAHGACLKGEHCEYAHDWSASANNICTFYQRGACAYGSRCRYDHVKVPRIQPSGSSSSAGSNVPTISRPPLSTGVAISAMAPVTNGQANLSQSKRQFVLPVLESRSQVYKNPDTQEDNEVVEGVKSDNLAEQVICSFAAAGDCPRGDKCPHIHGDLCPTCGKHCLHPFRPKEREEHSRTCERMQKHVEALKRSQEIECSVCLERVLLKPAARERKFGLLSECDHPFCITCIRNWRSSSPTSGMDVNSTLRACPICRKLSYYVIPSVIWYFSKEEKDQIVENYKAKLKSIDCKYFDFGNGSCPFGSSCFYKHKVKRGSRLWKRAMNPNMFADPPFRNPFNNNEHSSFSYMDTVRDLFGDMFQPRNGMPGMVDIFNSIDVMEFQMKIEELQRKYPGGFSEEDFPTPEDIWSLLEYDMSDGDDDYDDDEDDYFSAGFGEDDFLTPWDMWSLLQDVGVDEGEDDDEYDDEDDDEYDVDDNDDDDNDDGGDVGY